jgi:subtilisin-like proprotein convertase family protein
MRALLVTALALVTACADDQTRGELIAPDLAEGKADAGDKVTRSGPLGLEAAGAKTGVFTEDLEFHGYELTLRPGANVHLEVTQKGTTRGLDTTLYVYGPKNTTGAFGSTARAFDDDAGYGKLSLIKWMTVPEGGTLLVVVGTRNGRGRGNYRLEARCMNGACEPQPEPEAACHPAFLDAIGTCVGDWQSDGDYDSTVTSAYDLTWQCADVEPMAPVRDNLCATASHSFCALDMERFSLDYLPACRTAALNDLLDDSCVFGDRYRDLFDRAEAMVVLGQRTFTANSTLTALQKSQVIQAVRATAYDDVATVEDAFDAVDEGLVHMAELWDASNRKAFTVFEVGAGDNSFGAVFAQGTSNIAATINDGDFYDCKVTWGNERRRCEADTECRGDAKCLGRSDASRLGRCIDPALDNHPAETSECRVDAVDFGCPAGSGLLCAGASVSGQGMCLPAWMRSRFASQPGAQIPDNKSAGVSAQLLAFGLATVDMDVKMDLHIAHPRPADVRVTLTNPAGNEVLVFDGATGSAPHGEIYMKGQALRGFSGDESVNGTWSLKVVDSRSGQVGTLYSFGLEITSRWD